MTPYNSAERGRLPLLGLVGGPLAGAMLLLLPPPAGLEPAAWSVAAVTLLMVVWWITEALPVAATALVPIVAFPLLGVAGIGAATAPYAHPLIFLFLGGFLLAKAIERCNLHRRTALTILGAVGAAPHRLIGGFMAATAALSMWLSNTATAIMMLPIALAASIGGIGTLIGTPPNALLAAFLAERYGIVIGFGRWMLFGLPLAAVLLALCWLLLTRVVFRVGRQPIPGAAETIAAELRGLGRASRDERMVAAVFATVAALWVLRPLINDALPMLGLSDTGIALLGGLALFAIPADLPRRRFLLDWEAAKTLPWGVLLLFGGGLSLASAIESSGLAAWIGALLEARAGWPVVAVVLLVTALVVFLTEVTSNTATASVFIPIAAGLGAGAAEAPLLYATAVALSASCAFMMPVATPPNAIVYASGELTIPQMARAGLWLNLVCIVVITAAVSWLAGPLLGLAP